MLRPPLRKAPGAALPIESELALVDLPTPVAGPGVIVDLSNEMDDLAIFVGAGIDLGLIKAGVEGGIAAAYRRELDALPEQERAARLAHLEAYYERLGSPFLTAEKFRVPDIIDPRDTRRVLCHWIEDAYRTLPEQLGTRGRTMRK